MSKQTHNLFSRRFYTSWTPCYLHRKNCQHTKPTRTVRSFCWLCGCGRRRRRIFPQHLRKVTCLAQKQTITAVALGYSVLYNVISQRSLSKEEQCKKKQRKTVSFEHLHFLFGFHSELTSMLRSYVSTKFTVNGRFCALSTILYTNATFSGVFVAFGLIFVEKVGLCVRCEISCQQDELTIAV